MFRSPVLQDGGYMLCYVLRTLPFLPAVGLFGFIGWAGSLEGLVSWLVDTWVGLNQDYLYKSCLIVLSLDSPAPRFHISWFGFGLFLLLQLSFAYISFTHTYTAYTTDNTDSTSVLILLLIVVSLCCNKHLIGILTCLVSPLLSHALSRFVTSGGSS